MKKILLPLILTQILFGVSVTEYLYEPINFVFNDDRIVTNNTESDKEFPDKVFIHDLTPSVVINNFVNRTTQHMIPFNNWNAGDYTGLTNASEQWGFTGANDSNVIPSNTTIQGKNKKVGMLLNTTSQNLVTSNTATSIQYVVGWIGDEGIGANIWNTRPNDDLCFFAEVEINSSLSTDNNSDGITTANQTLITYIFRVNNSDKSFFYNITLHESRGYENFSEFLMPVDGQDTVMPIVVTLTPSNSPSNNHHGQNESRYAKATRSFGLPLQSFSSGAAPIGSKYYGSCIGTQEMKNIITDIKSHRSDFNIPEFTIENIRLDTVIMGPEINTNTTRTYNADGTINNPGFKEEGLLGMTLHGLTVYRLGEISTVETPDSAPLRPTKVKIASITGNSAILSWEDTSDTETGFKIYRDNLLVATLAANTTTYTFENLQYNTNYTYTIVSYNTQGESSRQDISFQTKDNYAWLIPIYHIILN